MSLSAKGCLEKFASTTGAFGFLNSFGTLGGNADAVDGGAIGADGGADGGAIGVDGGGECLGGLTIFVRGGFRTGGGVGECLGDSLGMGDTRGESL